MTKKDRRKKEERNHRQKYNGLPYFIGRLIGHKKEETIQSNHVTACHKGFYNISVNKAGQQVLHLFQKIWY